MKAPNQGRSSSAVVAACTAIVEEAGGAWPFLVGGLPCQVDSGNERDLSLSLYSSRARSTDEKWLLVEAQQ
jgi:hypothetical protein